MLVTKQRAICMFAHLILQMPYTGIIMLGSRQLIYRGPKAKWKQEANPGLSYSKAHAAATVLDAQHSYLDKETDNRVWKWLGKVGNTNPFNLILNDFTRLMFVLWNVWLMSLWVIYAIHCVYNSISQNLNHLSFLKLVITVNSQISNRYYWCLCVPATYLWTL